MRRLVIFIYFLIMMTMSLRLREFYATLLLMPSFLIFYVLGEKLDEEDQ
jgi:hypothetical protein